MTYSITHVAKLLMLEPPDLKNVFDVFFRSAEGKIEESRRFLITGDFAGMARSMHAIKGIALSLHMISIGELATMAERTDSLSTDALCEILDQLEEEVRDVRETVQMFYK